MFSVNVAPSQELPNKDHISPQSISTAGGAVTSGWVDASSGPWIQAIVALGALTSSPTITATWDQATSSAGGNVAGCASARFARSKDIIGDGS